MNELSTNKRNKRRPDHLGIDSNQDIYGQLVAAEIVEFLGGSIASGLANLAQVNLNAAIAIIASGIGQLAPGTEAAALVFLRNIGIEKFFGFLQYAASGGFLPVLTSWSWAMMQPEHLWGFSVTVHESK